jgi:anti-sigma factor ChrR (cupin superfamily)
MTQLLVNADLTQRAVVDTAAIPWTPSPQAGVERRFLDRIGDEVARATTLVRYAPGSFFPEHVHGRGEEFLVLEGVFSDAAGDYPAGTYVRNPPVSRHAPFTRAGCVILVKLRQMAETESARVVVDTGRVVWDLSTKGRARLDLYRSVDESVSMMRLAAGAELPDAAGGEELYVLSGALLDEHGRYGAGTWLRHPPGFRRRLSATAPAVIWTKRGHLESPI